MSIKLNSHSEGKRHSQTEQKCACINILVKIDALHSVTCRWCHQSKSLKIIVYFDTLHYSINECMWYSLTLFRKKNWIYILTIFTPYFKPQKWKSVISFVTCILFLILFMLLWVRVGKLFFNICSNVIFLFKALFFLNFVFFVSS